MKYPYHFKMRAMLWAILGSALLASAPAMAGEPAWWTQQKRDCGLPSSLAYNDWDGSCNSSSGVSGNSSGGVPFGGIIKRFGDWLSNSGSSASDQAHQQRLNEEAKAEAEAERLRQQAEDERFEREHLADEKRKNDEIKRLARDTELKGSSGMYSSRTKDISDMGSGDNALKDAVRDSAPPITNVQAKQAAAWKQVHCAASIAQYALAALQTKAEYDVFGTLSVEAFKALDGQETNVKCQPAPAFTNLKNKPADMAQIVDFERKLLQRATVIAERMKQRGDKPETTQQPTPKPPANETLDEKNRRVQKEINKINDGLISGNQQEINQKEKDRIEITELIIKNNNLVSGNIVDRSYGGLDKVYVPPPAN